MLKGAILPVLIRFAAPFMFTAFIQMIYQLTDIFWIGRLSDQAVASVGIVGFLLWIGESIAFIARTGMGVELAKNVGASNEKEASKIVAAGVKLSILLALVYCLLVELFLEDFVSFYDLEEVVSKGAMDYGRIALLGLACNMVNFTFAQIYQSHGNSDTPFRISALGLLFNMILDPLFIFVFSWGLKGAAWATVLAQFGVTLIFLYSFHQNQLLGNKQAYYCKMDLDLSWKIFRLGLPVSLLSIVYASVSVILNKMMALFGSLGVAVFSIGSQIESISWMSAEGFAGAITAMLAQNIGANDQKRADKIFWVSLKSTFLLGILTGAILLVFRSPLFSIFLPKSKEGIILGARYLFIFSFSQPFATLEAGAGACFHGYGQTVIPSAISISLNLFRIPLSYLLMQTYGLFGIWIAMSLISIFRGTSAFLVLLVYKKRAIDKKEVLS